MEGWIKINIDGAARGQDGGNAGCGVLVSDAEGRWLGGFVNRVGPIMRLNYGVLGQLLLQ